MFGEEKGSRVGWSERALWHWAAVSVTAAFVQMLHHQDMGQDPSGGLQAQTPSPVPVNSQETPLLCSPAASLWLSFQLHLGVCMWTRPLQLHASLLS